MADLKEIVKEVIGSNTDFTKIIQNSIAEKMTPPGKALPNGDIVMGSVAFHEEGNVKETIVSVDRACAADGAVNLSRVDSPPLAA